MAAISLAQLDDEPYPCRSGTTRASCDPCTALSVVENRIRQTVFDLQALLDKHQSMKTDLHREDDSITRKLPPEIISHIFLHCRPNDIQNHLKKADRGRDFFVPMKLGAVSRTWRQIAWSTPRLWAQLVISPRGLKIDLNTEHELVKQWIARSRTVPLSIYLGITEIGYYGYQEDDGGPPRRYRPLLDTIAQCSEQWQDIYLNVPSQFLVYLLEKPTVIPNIRVLDLRSSTSSYKAPTLFRNAFPGPRCISLQGLNLNQVNINWSTVTQFNMAILNVDKCIDLMRLAPVLQSCTFSDMTNYDCIPPYSSPILTLPNLKYLNMKAFSTYPPSVFLSAVSLPNLTQLTLSTTFKKYTSYSSFATVLERSAPTLTDLRLIGPALRFGFGTLRAILQATPSVTHLVLGEHPCDRDDNEEIDDNGKIWLLDKQSLTLDPFFQHIADTSSSAAADAASSQLLPNLKSVELSVNFAFKWSELVYDIFGRDPLVCNTRPRRRQLESLKIKDRCSKSGPSIDTQYIPRSILSRVLDLRAQGFEIVYTHQGGEDIISASRDFHGV